MMHQPINNLPSIFSIGDLEALGDDGDVEWDMDVALLEGCCSAFSADDEAGCMLPQPGEYDGVHSAVCRAHPRRMSPSYGPGSHSDTRRIQY